jgi:hypothetical protein
LAQSATTVYGIGGPDFNAAAGAIAAPNKHRARKVFMRLSVSECTPEVKNGRMACPAPAVTPLREAQYRSVTL